jgi:hypothetical protein
MMMALGPIELLIILGVLAFIVLAIAGVAALVLGGKRRE